MGLPIERRCQVSNPFGIGVIKRNPRKFINFRPAEVVCPLYLKQLLFSQMPCKPLLKENATFHFNFGTYWAVALKS